MFTHLYAYLKYQAGIVLDLLRVRLSHVVIVNEGYALVRHMATGHLFSAFEGCTTSKKSDKFGIEIGIEVGMT